MTLLIHGNDNLTSRNYFTSLKDENSMSFDAENINLVELNQSISGAGLFQSSKKILIDNLFTKKGAKNQKEIIELANNANNVDIYIYADKEIALKDFKIKDLDAKLFKIPQTLWSFLDGIRPNNPQNVFEFHKTIEGNEVEIIFSMIVRQFRLLLATSTTTKTNITEFKRLAPWQKSKLISQASFFSEKSLKNILKKLYLIDKSTKTGKANLNLEQNIDILLVEI